MVNLRENLKKLNSDLVTEHSKPVESIRRIFEKCNQLAKPVVGVVYQKEVTFEELEVERAVKEFCQAEGAKVTELWGSTLYHRQDIPYKNVDSIPNTYTQFRKVFEIQLCQSIIFNSVRFQEVESRSRVRPVVEMPPQLKPFPPGYQAGHLPSLEDLGVDPVSRDHRTAFPFTGGESSGLARLQDYLWGTHSVAQYKETRNGLVGQNYSTKFSPWLAHGCLSPRMIHDQIKKYEKSEVANQSTYWVLFELIWRDYFKFVCLKFGDRVFHRSGILGRDQPWSQDMDQFKAWAEGRTGVPFVDANMRELKQTGWMSNRGRQNVASFLVKDLGLDWRLGAEWFESQLLDHDVCSNYGNWNYAAGIGNDPRENRKFNMIKQAMDYDREGKFVRLWVEELGEVKGSGVHMPWTLTRGELEKANLEIGVDYPKPMLVAPEWNRHQGGGGGAGGKSNQRSNNGQQKITNFYSKSGDQTKSRNKKPLPKGGRIQY